jgi:ubiquinone/menaquinone biosynthesis C-methylase UbiE
MKKLIVMLTLLGSSFSMAAMYGEAGCGLGKWLIYLKSKGYKIEGIDFFDGVVKELKKYDKSLQVQVGDVESLRIKSNSLDQYLSFGVVEHWEQGPQKPLAEAFRVLKRGGIAIIETPCNSPLQRLIRALVETKRLLKLPAKIFVEALGLRKKRDSVKTKFYEYHYSPQELASHVEKAGFKILEVLPKDDLGPNRSIGLWLDLPFLRQKGRGEFELNTWGKIFKMLISPFPWLWSYCVVVVATKGSSQN